MFGLNEAVILRRGLPAAGIAPGTRALIAQIHGVPGGAYDVKVVDRTGTVVRLGPVPADDLEPVETSFDHGRWVSRLIGLRGLYMFFGILVALPILVGLILVVAWFVDLSADLVQLIVGR